MIELKDWQKDCLKFCAEDIGLPYEALEKAIIINLTNLEIGKVLALTKIKNIIELSIEDCKTLRNQITLNSLYIHDYENSFGINPKMLSDIMEGYVEELRCQSNPDDEDGEEINWALDTPRALYDYFQYNEWSDEYLEDLVRDKKHEVEEEYNKLVENFWECEEYYSLAGTVQHKLMEGIL